LEMWGQWGGSFAADSTMKFFLIQEKNYNEGSVANLIADYKDTIAFAKLRGSDKLANAEGGCCAPKEISADSGSQLSPKSPAQETILMNEERIIFAHEIEPSHAVRIIACGEVDESMLDALQLYIELQKRRRGRQRANTSSQAE
ncbi:MAG: hypothetical protein ACREQE_06870, partial [Candidatus Binataceae bacterium]